MTSSIKQKQPSYRPACRSLARFVAAAILIVSLGATAHAAVRIPPACVGSTDLSTGLDSAPPGELAAVWASEIETAFGDKDGARIIELLGLEADIERDLEVVLARQNGLDVRISEASAKSEGDSVVRVTYLRHDRFRDARTGDVVSEGVRLTTRLAVENGVVRGISTRPAATD